MAEPEYLPVKRPSCYSKNVKERKLAVSLRCYTTPGSGCYDAAFTAQIFALQPFWEPHKYREFKTKENMQRLLEMAKSGAKKPFRPHYLANVLHNYEQAYPEFIKQIREIRPDWYADSRHLKAKQKLLEMARTGKERPSHVEISERYLSATLYKCTCNKPTNRTCHYDPEFDAEIRKIRPDWFDRRRFSAKRKRILLEMARSGAKRPSSDCNSKNKKLASSLCTYTSKKSECYDPEFDAEIRKIRPDWFGDWATAERKLRLLAIARSGAKRPSVNSDSKLAGSLMSFTCLSGHYDPEFDAEIRRLRPDWFRCRRKRGCTRESKERKLLEMARNGEKRPSASSKNAEERRLGGVLCSYTSKNNKCYSREFDVEIREARPDWFDMVAIDKRKLLEMARNGEKRPNNTSKNTEERHLGRALYNYISKSRSRDDRRISYDPEFYAEMRRLRPDWFEDTTIPKKRKLLEMAKSGWKRPTGILGQTLSRYTRPGVFDQEFDREIRAARPDWFRCKQR